jgi:hypothetical protein
MVSCSGAIEVIGALSIYFKFKGKKKAKERKKSIFQLENGFDMNINILNPSQNS